MKPLIWIGAGAAAVITLLLTRRTETVESPVVKPELPPGEQTRVALAVPTGWRRVASTEVSALPELVGQANALRSSSNFVSLPYGTLTPFAASDGKIYATWIEQHYHEPRGAARPWGLHHGVTLLTRADQAA